MSMLNMTVEPLGGSLANEAFLALAHNLAGDEGVYVNFKKDTGDDLTVLLMCESKELVAKYFDWVAMRYWGVQCHSMDIQHTKEVYELIQSVDKPAEEFIKSTEDEVKSFVGQALIIFQENKIVGVLLVKDGLIDTIVSSVKGMGVHLVSSLPEGGYAVNISEKNKEALSLFKKFEFKQVGCGQKMGLYEGQIKH